MTGVIYGVRVAGGDSTHIAYFEEPAGPGMVRLTAVAIWHAAPARPWWSLRTQLRRLRAHFGPLGLGVHLKHRFRPWIGSAGPHGEQETLYDPAGRVVKVLGREYPVPADGRTLVLLIDERSRARRIPRVAVRSVDIPAVSRDAGGESAESWLSLLGRDEEIRAFIGALLGP